LSEPISKIKARKENNGIKDIREELHSKFGVEYDDLAPELEEYYKQYFLDHSKVVALFRRGGFNSRMRRIEEVENEAKSITPQLTSMQNQMAAYKKSGDTAKYNSLVGSQNKLAAKYNALAAESQKLYKELKEFYQYFNPDFQPASEGKTE